MKRKIYIVLALLLGFLGISAQSFSIENPIKFLALGDSYTIGQSVAVQDRWPNQLLDSLSTLGFEVEALEIIAETGWNTFNLLNVLEADMPTNDYTLVSLLVGVNNQYQGRTIQEYIIHFEELLLQAIDYAGGIKERVFVVSIPDYAYTPFGNGLAYISEAIDAFNSVNSSMANFYEVTYINITDISRRGLDEPELVANDGLHPSGMMYKEWVDRILESAILEEVITSTVSQPIERKTFSFFPNPASHSIYFHSDKLTNVQIFDADKRLVLNKEVFNNTISIQNLEKGMYLLQLQEGENISYDWLLKQ